MVDSSLEEFTVNNLVGATAVAQFCIVGYSGKRPCIIFNMRSGVFKLNLLLVIYGTIYVRQF